MLIVENLMNQNVQAMKVNKRNFLENIAKFKKKEYNIIGKEI